MKSVELLKRAEVDNEFRTTFVPELMSVEDVLTIADQLKGAKRYALQQFVPRTTIDKKLERLEPASREELHNLVEKIKNVFQTFELRN